MRVVGVLPAAGYATRLQPLDVSKELLPVAGRPVIDYVVERMRVAHCDEIRIVTRPEKTDLVAYAREIGARVVLARPSTVSASFAAGIRGLAAADVVLIGWPDSIWEPLDGYTRLVRALTPEVEVALGLFRLERDLERSDVVTRDDAGRVTGVHVKPAKPPSDWTWGCAAVRASRLAGLEREEWPGGYFDSLCREGVEIAGVELSDRWLDIGTRDALARASDWVRERSGLPGARGAG